MLQNIPAILRVLVVFAFILVLIRKKLSLGNAFLLSSIFLSLLFQLPVTATLKSIANSIFYPKTLYLAVIVGLILILSSSMEAAGQMQRLLERFRGLISSQKLNLAIFPALIGLLPMPGGAVFSAPMVKELGTHSKLLPNQLSFINYWFRHIWEYWWPMYPGVLLATLMADLNLAVFVVFLFPLTIIAVSLGWRPLKHIDIMERANKKPCRPPLWPFIKELMPILIVIIPGLSLGALFSWVFPSSSVTKEGALILSLCVAIGWIWHDNDFSRIRMWGMIKNPHLLKMVYMVFAILIFKGILQDSLAVETISGELMVLNVSLVFVSVILPFIVGTITGITIAFAGSTFPILIPLIQSHGEGQFMLAYVMLALVSGFTGVLLSPLHLCLVFSNEYFGTSPGPVYKYLWMPCAGLMVSGLVYFWVLHGLCQWIW